MMTKKMKIDEIIHDLKEVGKYFEEETGGSIPLCIPQAIELLEALKKIKEICK